MTKNIDFNLSGKIALITGGCGEIGSYISKSLLMAGCSVIVTSRNCKDETCNQYKCITTDVTKEDDIQELNNKILDTYGKVDILIMSHGIQKRAPFHNFNLQEWQKIITTNMTSVFLLCKYFSNSMKQRRQGKIIGITSLTSHIGIPNISAYSASKGGMQQFLKSIAIELAPYNIQVNMVAPGRIKTRMTNDILKNEIIEKQLNLIPAKRIGYPQDIAGAALFLSSDYSNYMIGETIVIDGGWLASGGDTFG